MKRLSKEELTNDFEREFIWREDEIKYYNSNQRKAAVMEYHLRLKTILEFVRKHAPGKRIADFACGPGNVALQLAEDGFIVDAVDIKKEFLDYARKRQTSGEVNYINTNIMEYTHSEPYDCIIMGEIIEHVAYPKTLLQSAFRNLRPGGVLVLSTPNGELWGSNLPTFSEVKDPSLLIKEQFHWENHLFLYTEPELKGLLSGVGFETLNVEKITSQFAHQLKGIRYLLPQSALEWLERQTRSLKKDGKERVGTIVLAAQKGSGK